MQRKETVQYPEPNADGNTFESKEKHENKNDKKSTGSLSEPAKPPSSSRKTSSEFFSNPSTRRSTNKNKFVYSSNYNNEYLELKNKIQNHIYAFKFENPTKGDGFFDKPADMAFAILEKGFRNHSPYEKIQVSKIDPKYKTEMHAVLKAAIKSLDDKDPKYFDAELAKYDGKYDQVKTKLFGRMSISHSENLKKLLSTFNDQPGYYIYKLVKETKSFLQKACPEYDNSKSNVYMPANQF